MKVGEIRDSKFNGQMKITGITKNGITVQFTDGMEVETTYQKFLDDDVRVSIHEITEQAYDKTVKALKSIVATEMINDTISSYGVVISRRGKKNWRVGEIHTANNGQQFKIVGYNGASKISVMFEDGTIVPNRKYCHIKTGEVKNPNLRRKMV